MLTEEEIQHFIQTVKSVSNYDFTDYSEKSFARRMQKIMSDYKLTLYALNQKVIREPLFLEQVVKDITVNTTELFRDPKIWQAIKHRLIYKLKEKEEINIWHAGCSTGQEVYSMLILLNELGMLEKTNVYATDINTDVIEKAKKGEYVYRFNVEYLENFNQVVRLNPYNFEEYNDIPFSKYFEVNKSDDKIIMKDFLRDKVYYKKHNLVNEDNIFYKKFDIIFCRNVMIYFNTRLQNRLFRLFHDSLARKGYLVLGMHESILGAEAAKYNRLGYFYLAK